ncbi:MAG: hypothetical protein ABJA77_08375 [Variovorax sp.]
MRKSRWIPPLAAGGNDLCLEFVAVFAVAPPDIGLSGFAALGGGVVAARIAWVHGFNALCALNDPANLQKDQPAPLRLASSAA